MTENISGSSLEEIDTEQLTNVSEQWFKSAQGKTKLANKLDVIRSLAKGITALVESGYTYARVSQKLKDELHIDISAQTIRIYVQKIHIEQKKSESKAKRAAAKLAKTLQQPQVEVTNISQLSLTEISESNASPLPIVQKLTDHQNTDQSFSVSQSTDTKPINNNESSKLKSIVPKSVPVDDDDDDDYLAQQKILKHYNRY